MLEDIITWWNGLENRVQLTLKYYPHVNSVSELTPFDIEKIWKNEGITKGDVYVSTAEYEQALLTIDRYKSEQQERDCEYIYNKLVELKIKYPDLVPHYKYKKGFFGDSDTHIIYIKKELNDRDDFSIDAADMITHLLDTSMHGIHFTSNEERLDDYVKLFD